MGVDRPLVGLERDTVDRVEQLGPGEDPPRLTRHRRQDRELRRREVDRTVADAHVHPRHVEDQVADRDPIGGLGSPLRAS